jgi:hypothetical protein
VGEPGRLGHRRLDHHHEVQGLERLPPSRGVGVRQHGVGALDDQRAQSLRMIGQDFLGNERGREHREAAEGADGGDAGDQRALGLRELDALRIRRIHPLDEHVPPALAQVAGERQQHANQIGVEGRERHLLDAQVVQDASALGGRELAGDPFDDRSLDAAGCGHARQVDGAQRPAERLVTGRAAREELAVDPSTAHDARGEPEQQ